MKNTITELEKTVEGINSKLDEPEEWISDTEFKNSKKKNEDSLRDLWHIKLPTLPKEEEGKKHILSNNGWKIS